MRETVIQGTAGYVSRAVSIDSTYLFGYNLSMYTVRQTEEFVLPGLTISKTSGRKSESPHGFAKLNRAALVTGNR